MTLFFRNCKVLPMTAAAGEPNCFDGYVGVEGRRIALVTADAAAAEAWRAAHAGAREIDGRGGILMPGLVYTHCHMAMTLQRSYADDMALMEWLNDHIWPFEARQTDDDIRVGALLGAAEMMVRAARTHIPSVSAALTAAGLDTFANIPFLTGYTAANLPILL